MKVAKSWFNKSITFAFAVSLGLSALADFEVADGFYQNAATYGEATEFYITNKDGFHFFRNLINKENGAIEDYRAKGFYGLEADQFYTENPFKNKTVKLLCDVDEEDVAVKPIGMTAHSSVDGKDKRYFYGIFDGGNHTISNLRVVDDPPTDKHRVGLFGVVARNAEVAMAGIVNLTVSNAVVSGCNYVGGFIGGLTGGAVTLTNCHLKGSVTISGTKSYVGGLVGHNGDGYDAQIIGCSVDVADGSTLTVKSQGGGLAGYMGGGDIIGCTVRGLAINASGSYVLGGIAGKFCETGCVAASNTVDSVTITAKNAGASGSIIGSFGAAGQTLIDNTVVNTHVYEPNDVEVFGQCHWFASGDTTTVIGWNSVGTLTDGGITGGTFERLPDSYIASGYEKVAQGTTPETYVVQKAVTPVCMIAETPYESLAAAVAAVEASDEFVTIKMVDNEAFTGTNPLKIDAGKKIVLDLNGCTLSYVSSNTESDAFIWNEGCLTVTDTSANKDGKITAKQNPDPSWSYGCYTIQNWGTYDTVSYLVIEAGTIENTSNAGLVYPISNGAWGRGGDCVINGGTIHCVNYVAIREYLQNGAPKTLTINGGTIVSDKSRAVGVQFCDETVQDTGSYVKITGGTFTANGDGVLYFDMHKANTDTSGLTYEVTGGTFVNNNANGAVVKYDYEGKDYSSAVDVSSFIKGGTYNLDPTAWVAEDYEAAYDSETGKWTIAEAATIAQVTIGGVTTKYGDLHEALEAAKADGSLCELLSDVTLTGTWTPVGTEDSPFQGDFDGKGFTISGLSVDVTGGNVGFFGKASEGIIKNVTLSQPNVKGTGIRVGALVGYGFREDVSNVTVTAATVTGKQYVGGIAGGTYCDVIDSTITDSTITGDEQVGGVIGYSVGSSVSGCTATGNTVTGESERAGGLIGKLQIGDSGRQYYDNNTVSGTVSAPDMAGGIAAMIMGGDGDYEIKNNDIDVTLLNAAKKSPIGVLRTDSIQAAAFTSAIAANCTGNWWTDDTLDANSYTYVAADTGTTAQTVYRGVAVIGQTPYKTLKAAIAAAEAEDTVKLLCDVALDDVLSIAQDLSVTLDLNGKTIVSTSDVAFEVNGSLIVIDSDNTGSIEHTGAYGIFDVNGAVVIDGGTFTSDQWFLTSVGANITINDGTFNATASLSVSGSMTITNGRFAADDLQVESDGTLVISGGIFSFEPKMGVAPGYRVESNTGSMAEDYPFTVALAPVALVVSAEGTETNECFTLQAAFDAVQAGETIEVMQDNDEEIVITTPSAFYVKANGHTLSATAPVVPAGWKFVQNEDVCVLGEIVDTNKDEEKTAVVIIDKQSASVDETEVAKVIDDEEVVEKITQNTTITGVKLVASNETHAVSGAQSVVDSAKASGGDEFASNLEKGTNVIIKVDVEVKPLVYTAPVQENTDGTIKFNLKPVATVTIDEGGENKTNTVEVTNEMIDQMQDIVVTVYTGFKPVQAVHTDKNGDTIQIFDEKEIEYDSVSGNATIIINHFSDVVFYEETKLTDGVTVEGCKDNDNAEKDVFIPGSWLRAYEISEDDATNTAHKVANGLTAWESYVLGVDPNSTIPAGSIEVLPQADGTVNVAFSGVTADDIQTDLATVTFGFSASTVVSSGYAAVPSQENNPVFTGMQDADGKRFFKDASITFTWKDAE